MIDKYIKADPEDENGAEWIIAEDQCWDGETLKQLWDEHSVVFMTGGNGVFPIKVCGSEIRPLLAIGSEDDGIIRFDTYFGHYAKPFSAYWVDSLIADLKEAKRRVQRRFDHGRPV